MKRLWDSPEESSDQPDKTNMETVQELENEIVFAMLIENKYREGCESEDILSLLINVNDALKSVSARDHSNQTYDSSRSS